MVVYIHYTYVFIECICVLGKIKLYALSYIFHKLIINNYYILYIFLFLEKYQK